MQLSTWIIIIAIPVGIATIRWCINKIGQIEKRKNINFDEFDSIEKIQQKDLREKREIQYESDVLNQVYKDTYDKSIKNSIEEKNKYHSYEEKQDANIFDGIEAHLKAKKAVEKAKRDLYNFSIVDSVEVEKDEVLEGNPINALRENGHSFDVELFKKWSRQIFGCIKIGTKEQLEIVKKFISEDLYNKLEGQKKAFEKDGLEFITEDLVIENCKLYDYGRSMSKEEIKILICASMKEYILQKSTNKIIRGSNTKAYNKKIILTFRKHNIDGKEGVIQNCPNCGAEISQTEFGKCRYCDTLIFPIRYNWTLIDFQTM